MNLAEEILKALTPNGERIAVTVLDVTGRACEHLPRADLVAASAHWRSRFETFGLRPGQRIVLSPERSAELAAVHLGALAAGLAVVPLNPALSSTEAGRLLDCAGPSLIVTSQAVADARIAMPNDSVGEPSCPWWVLDTQRPRDGSTDTDGREEAGLRSPPGRPAPVSRSGLASPADGTAQEGPTCRSDLEPRPDGIIHRAPSPAHGAGGETALVLFTSGTTGHPKSVPLTHTNLLANLRALAALWHLTDTDRVLHMLPAHHFHGLVLALYGSLLAGSEIVMLPAFDARLALDVVRTHKITVAMGVPTMYARMIGAAGDGDDLSGMRLAVSGSAPLGAALWRRFHERFGIGLVERYGLTETGIVASNPPHAPRAGSVGQPLEGTRVVIEDQDRHHEAMPGRQGPRGEVCVAGPSVMAGYGNDPEATATALRNGLFHTGDLGFFDADGYLWIDGRIKDLIIVGGSNVVPGEVEAALETTEGVAEVAVVGIAHEDLGEVVAALIVPTGEGLHGGSSPHPPSRSRLASLEAALRERADEKLARYKRPRRYAFVHEIPRNTMGKVDRKRCQAAFTSSGDL